MPWKQLKVTLCRKPCRTCRHYDRCRRFGLLPKLKNGCDQWEAL